MSYETRVAECLKKKELQEADVRKKQESYRALEQRFHTALAELDAAKERQQDDLGSAIAEGRAPDASLGLNVVTRASAVEAFPAALAAQKQKVEQAKHLLESCRADAIAAFREKLENVDRVDNLESIHRLWDLAKDLFANSIAIEKAINFTYADSNRAPKLLGYVEQLGHAAKLLSELRNLEWPSHPYPSLKPEWMPRHGPWEIDELPEVLVAEAAIQ